MPYARRTLTQLRQDALADISSRISGVNTFLRRSALNVLGLVLADQHNEQLGYLDWIAREAIPVTATAEHLDMWAALRGAFREPATFASGTVTIAGGIPDSLISAGVEMTRLGDGLFYQVQIGATVAGDGTATISVIAETAGIASDCDPGVVLNFVSSISGIPQQATVALITGGADIENDQNFRTRMLQAWALPPQGGDLNDYVTWTRQVAGPTRAWAGGSAIMGAGTVAVYFMIDDVAHANGIPEGANGVSQFETRASAATGDQLRVADHIFPLRPVTALVYALAPVADTVNLTIGEVPADATIRAGIADALNGFLLREASPGGVTLPDLSAGGTIRVSRIENAIAAVPGLDHFVLTSPAGDLTVATGHIHVPGVITFT